MTTGTDGHASRCFVAAVVSLEEIAKLGAFPDYRYNPELAADPRMARYEPGVSLYLASGTDVEDVKREAEALGYAEYFDGGIYGSVGDIDRDPKRAVLERLLRGVDAADEASPGSKGEYIFPWVRPSCRRRSCLGLPTIFCLSGRSSRRRPRACRRSSFRTTSPRGRPRCRN